MKMEEFVVLVGQRMVVRCLGAFAALSSFVPRIFGIFALPNHFDFPTRQTTGMILYDKFSMQSL